MQEHIDYITPGIKLISEGYGKKRAPIPRRSSESEAGEIESDIAHIEQGSSVEATEEVGPCTYEVTPSCVRGKSACYDRPQFMRRSVATLTCLLTGERYRSL